MSHRWFYGLRAGVLLLISALATAGLALAAPGGQPAGPATEQPAALAPAAQPPDAAVPAQTPAATSPPPPAPAATPEASPAAAPDLVVVGITLTPAQPGAGGTADIAVVIENRGDGKTTVAFNLYLYVEPPQAPPVQGTPFTTVASYGLELGPGQRFTFARTGQAFSQAPPVVYAWVDPPWENAIAESNEENNLFPRAASGPDAFEEDDTCALARPIAPDGAAQERNLYRSPDEDVDWVRFDGVGGRSYVAEAVAVGADASLAVGLFSTCDGHPSFGGGARVEFTAPADGVYYLRLGSATAAYGPDSAYELRVTSDGGCADAFEPNNVCAVAGDLPLGDPQNHGFCAAGDVDWTRVAVTAGTRYRLGVESSGPQADPELTLFASCDSSTSLASGRPLEFTAAESGYLFLKVEQRDPAAHGPGAGYTLRSERLGAEGCVEDSFEQDDGAAGAKPIDTVGTVQSRNTCPPDDADWAVFSGAAGATYNAETLNLGAAADTVLCLYSAAGDEIACDDDSGQGSGSRLIFTPPTAGEYRLRVRQVSAAVAGPESSYDLRVTRGVCDGDEYEADDERDQARVVTVGGAATLHNFCPAGDQDWLAFSAVGGVGYLIESANPGPEADTVIELYNQAGALVAQNDDHTPGTSSLVAFTPPSNGTYFVRVRQYNPTAQGVGTEYRVRVRQGAPPPSPTVTPVPRPTATPGPGPTGVRTLILVNRARLAQLHGEAEAERIMVKLAALAGHTEVKGEIIRLEQNAEVAAAYALWEADQEDVERANQVTAAVRGVVLTYLQQRSGVAYMVLVGDDRALPMRRIPDGVQLSPERSYVHVDLSSPAGAALRANHYLSDDYFSDREPTVRDGQELYIPDLATGRLIETPAEIIAQIDAFLAAPLSRAENVLVTGYDFVQDEALADCEDWQNDIGQGRVNCALIGESWGAADLRGLQLRAGPPFKIQSISGHAAHSLEGAPDGGGVTAETITASAVDLRGGLVYTPGCHAGLNLPPSNPVVPHDLAQAFAGLGANYIGNTGYGYGSRSDIGYSERLMRLFTRSLLRGGRSSMGGALAAAKGLYYEQSQDFDPYDAKVMQQLVFYGLPMYQLETGASLADPGNPFPGVGFAANLPGASLDDTLVQTGSVRLDLSRAQNLALSQTADGNYYTLNTSSLAVAGLPVEPLHFGDVTAPRPARGVLLLGANYGPLTPFEPLIAAPVNEYVPAEPGGELPDPLALYPPLPAAVQEHNGIASLTTQVGQYDAAADGLRLLQSAQVELYYSTDPDTIGAQATVIDGITRAGSGRVAIKVGAVDPSGVARVLLSYIADVNAGTRRLESIDLSYDAATSKWAGSFSGGAASRYLVQIVDGAGNVVTATNKGRYYQPGVVAAEGPCANRCTYLPLVGR